MIVPSLFSITLQYPKIQPSQLSISLIQNIDQDGFFRQETTLFDLVVDDDLDIVVRFAGGINGLRKIIEPEFCGHDFLDGGLLLYDMVNDLGDDSMVIGRGTTNNRLVADEVAAGKFQHLSN